MTNVTLRPTTATNGTLAMEMYFSEKPDSTVTASLKEAGAHFSAKGSKGARWYTVDCGKAYSVLVENGLKPVCDKKDAEAIKARLGSTGTSKVATTGTSKAATKATTNSAKSAKKPETQVTATADVKSMLLQAAALIAQAAEQL